MARETSFADILAHCRPAFNAPSFDNFCTLARGWVHAAPPGRPASALSADAEPLAKHFASYYRFFARAAWSLDALGLCVLSLVLPFVAPAWVPVAVDDTLARKGGRKIWGANVHHDPLGFLKKGYFCFGHAWVTAAVLVSLPGLTRPVAVPILWRLYRSPRKRRGNGRSGPHEEKTVGSAEDADYRTRPELAAEMLAVLREALGERPMRVVGDTQYAGKSLVRHVPARTAFIGPIRADAVLHAPPAPRKPGQKGRSRKKGARLQTPAQRAEDADAWRSMKVRLYGRTVKLQYQSWTCLWYHTAGGALVRVVAVRDPRGRYKDTFLYATDPALTPQAIVEGYGLRWYLEVAFRDGKQELGFERSQARTQKAVERTAPFAFAVYALTLVWFARTGHLHWRACCSIAPWYRHKRTPSFADMLATLRVHLRRERFLTDPAFRDIPQNLREPLERAFRRVA